MNPLRFLPIAALIATAMPCVAAETVKDVALREARKCDADFNGKINGGEMMPLRAAFKNPKSYLYLFDDNSNHYLEDSEIAEIKFTPAAKPKPGTSAAPKSFWKTPPAGSQLAASKKKAAKKK